MNLVYRAEKKSWQILLSSTQTGPGRKVKQEQEKISRNHVPRLFLGSVTLLVFMTEKRGRRPAAVSSQKCFSTGVIIIEGGRRLSRVCFASQTEQNRGHRRATLEYSKFHRLRASDSAARTAHRSIRASAVRRRRPHSSEPT